MSEQLKGKQAAFVEEYLKDLNATQAAIRAGYSPKTAGQIGDENLKKPKIAAAIEKAKAERSERTKIDADWLLTRLANKAQADLADLYHPTTGQLKPVHEWPLIWRQGLVAGVKTRQERAGEDEELAEIVEVKLADRNSVDKMIGDHIGVQAFKQFVDHQHTHKFADLTEEQLNAKIAELQRKAGAG